MHHTSHFTPGNPTSTYKHHSHRSLTALRCLTHGCWFHMSCTACMPWDTHSYFKFLGFFWFLIPCGAWPLMISGLIRTTSGHLRMWRSPGPEPPPHVPQGPSQTATNPVPQGIPGLPGPAVPQDLHGALMQWRALDPANPGLQTLRSAPDEGPFSHVRARYETGWHTLHGSAPADIPLQ